jgi:hypothetical protein
MGSEHTVSIRAMRSLTAVQALRVAHLGEATPGMLI